MGRQQITIEDNSPVINDKTGGGAGGANGALMNRGTPLPKAGWQPYAPMETPGINPNLPKVPGPVRQSHNPQTRQTAGSRGHAGRIAAGTHGKSTPSNGVRSYEPYTHYAPPAANTQAAQELGASTHVKGNLLHWARRNPPQQ